MSNKNKGNIKFETIKIPGKNFEMMTHPVTQSQWKKVMGNNPSHFNNKPNNPVESVSWNDVQAFIKNVGCDVYRLPTEKEWEYCCRAVSTTEYYFGDDIKKLDKYAWYYDNSKQSTRPVKEKLPNKFGLYDMHGNVWEWTSSLWSKDSSNRVVRGGSWNYVPRNLRSADRDYGRPEYRYDSVGFRLVRTCNPKPSSPIALDKATLSEAIGEVQAALNKIKELLK